VIGAVSHFDNSVAWLPFDDPYRPSWSVGQIGDTGFCRP
jgi:hypothetical protein